MTDLLTDPTLVAGDGTTLQDAILNARKMLTEDPAFASLMANIGNTVNHVDQRNVWITTDTPNSIPTPTTSPAPPVSRFIGEGFYSWVQTIPGDATRLQWGKATSTGLGSPTDSFAVIFIDSSRWTATLDSVTGKTFYESTWPTGGMSSGLATVERMVVHELAHGVTDPSGQAFTDTIGTSKVNYNEEIASFVENTYYRPYAIDNQRPDTFLSMGHETVPTAGGVNGAAYFKTSLGSPNLNVNRKTGDITFDQYDVATDVILTKTYNAVDAIYSRFSTLELFDMNHVIKSTGRHSFTLTDWLVSGTTSVLKGSATSYADSSAVVGLTADIQKIFDAHERIVDFANPDTTIDNDGATLAAMKDMDLDWLYEGLSVSQDRILTIAADRYHGRVASSSGSLTIDVSGPTAHGTQKAPNEIVFDDTKGSFYFEEDDELFEYNTTGGTILIGASGHIATASNLSNTIASHDKILAGSGEDIIIGGHNNGSSGGNILDGGRGSDIFLEGTGKDTLNGGQGNDLFILGSAAGTGVTVNGNLSLTTDIDNRSWTGAGFDIVDLTAAGGVTYTKSTGIAVHNGRNDHLNDIDMIIGSATAANVFTASEMVLIGGSGADTFNMTGSKTVAMGAAGNDTFNINIKSSGPGDHFYMLMGFDMGDILKLDGQVFHGSTVSVSDAINSRTGLPDKIVSSTSAFTDSYYLSDELVRDGDYWFDYYSQGQADNGTDDNFATMGFVHKVDGEIVSSTTIFLTGFHIGEGGINYVDPHRDIIGNSGYSGEGVFFNNNDLISNNWGWML